MTLLDLFANPVAAFLADLIVKATLLLLLAAGLAAMLRKSSAAVRHRVWSLTFASLLLLPALSYVMPELQLPILPAEMVQPPAAEVAVEEVPEAKEPAPTPPLPQPEQLLAEQSTETVAPFDEGMTNQVLPWELDPTSAPPLETPLSAADDAEETETVADVSSDEPAEPVAAGPTEKNTGSLWLWIWGGGLSLFLLPVLAGLLQNRILNGLSEHVADSTITELLDALRARLSIGRRVRLIESAHSRIPLTWGLFRPVILLPENWRTWSTERKRLVLLHELAHVKRRDVAFQLLARTVCAVYWFHPLSWFALKRLKNESELACDDCVLLTGESPQQYASELVDIARSVRRAIYPAAVAMAQSSSLEQRIRALLDRARSRLPLGGRLAVLLFTLSFLTVAGIAAVRPVASEGAAEPVSRSTDEIPDESEVAETSDVLSTGDEKSEKTVEDDEKHNQGADELQYFHGKVIDPDGKPVAGASVKYLYSFVEYPAEKKWISRHGNLVTWPAVQLRVFDETTTDVNGSYQLSRDWSSFKREREQRGTGGDVYSSMLVASANGDGEKMMTGWIRDSSIPNGLNYGNPDTTIPLKPARSGAIRGQLIDLEGRPVAGARVTVPLAVSAQPEAVDRWIADIQRLTEKGVLSGDPNGSKLGIPFTPEENSARFPADQGLVTGKMIGVKPVVTDHQGRFEIPSPGDDCLVVLRIESEGNAAVIANVVTREIGHIEARRPEFHGGTKYHSRTPHDYHGLNSTIVVPPSQTIEGVIRDADTREPIPGIMVSVNRGESVSETDAEGRYRIDDVAAGAAKSMELYPRMSLPYFGREFIKVPAGNGTDSIELDFELKAGVWIEGQVVNQATSEGEPEFSLYYTPYLDNSHAREYPTFDSSILGGKMDKLRFWTDEEGNFRQLAIPGRGVVAAVYRGIGTFRKGIGAESIEGIGRMNINRRITYDLVPPGFYDSIAAVDIAADAKNTTVELKVDPGGTMTLIVQDQNSQPLEEFKVSGFSPNSIGSPRNDVQILKRALQFEPAHVKIQGLASEERRPVLLLNEEKRIGLVFEVDAANESGSEKTVKLLPLARVIGRLVDGNGNPVEAAVVRFDLKKTDLGLGISLEETFTDSDGKLDFPELLTGGTYSMVWLSDAFGVGSLGEIAPQPGETIDLGEIDITSADRPEPKRKPAKAGQFSVISPFQTQPGENRPEEKICAGQVFDEHDQPVAEADIAVIAWKDEPQRGGDYTPRGTILAEGTADEAGRYKFEMGGVSGQTHRYAHVIARKQGSAIAWKELNLNVPKTDSTLTLSPEQPLSGRLIDIDGKPAGGVNLRVRSVSKTDSNMSRKSGVGYRGIELPAAWIPEITTDSQGRFSIHGVPEGFGVWLGVEGSERFAPQQIALNTGIPEQRGERDGTYRPLVKNAAPGEEIVLALAPAQVFEGVVTYADTGEPAPHARLTIWASQQSPYGSMVSVAGQADAEGRYRITPKPGIRFGVNAYPPEGVPYLARRTSRDKEIHWKAGDRVRTVDVELPRGVLVKGRVVEQGTGQPVAGASIQYIPESVNNDNTSDEILTGWQDMQLTEKDGRFEMAVLPGPGRLLAHGPDWKYVLQEISSRELSRNQIGGRRNYAHAIEKINPETGSEPLDITLELQPGETVSGRVVDEQNHPIEKAVMITRLAIYPTNTTWRGSDLFQARDGRFELNCLADGEDYPVHFLDAERKLGATAVLSTRDRNPTVVLKPCGQARMRLVDSDGKPVAGHYPNIDIVVTPGVYKYNNESFQVGKLAADSDFISNVDRTNYPDMPKSDKEGELLLPVLIPGATYQITDLNNQVFKVTETFQVQAGESLDLGDVLVERPE